LSFAPLPIDKPHGLYYLSLALLVALFLFAQNVVASRVGRAFVAVRDGEVAAQSLGIDLLRYKALAFGISGFYAGIAGGLYSAMLNFVAPEGFDLFQMVLQKAMIVVGGLGSITGSLLGAALIIILLEALRAFKGLQEIVFGALLVAFVLGMRGGLVSLLKRHVRGWEEPLRLAQPSLPLARGRPIEVARRRRRAMSPVVLSLDDLHFSFGGVKVLDGVRMQVRRGEIRGLIGPNGAGKTTLLNIICGIHRPQQGDVRLNGVSIVGRKPSAIARLGLGRTFQSSQLFQGMTVLENMMVGLHRRTRTGLISAGFDRRRRRSEETEMEAAARAALTFVGLADLAERPAAALSFGQQRVIEIARTLISEPALVLLDEPAVGLSANRLTELDTLLRRIRQEEGRDLDPDRTHHPLGDGRL
jgi:ABC-type branched-subunit amino acid transport system ATPase component